MIFKITGIYLKNSATPPPQDKNMMLNLTRGPQKVTF